MRFQTALAEQAGKEVITLTDTETGCHAEIYGFGAMLNAFVIPYGNERINVIDGFDSVAEAMKNINAQFKSAKLSPFVCRMRHGQYEFNNKKFTIEKYFLSGHAIHGLAYDFSFRITDLRNDEGGAFVRLAYDYLGEDAGYPFPYSIEINWVLKKENRLSVTTKITNQHIHSIPVADGWHPYFTLGGSLDDCTLQFNSSRQLAYDADLLPTGNMVTDSRFTNGISLAGIELDNSFLLEENQSQPACILQNKRFVLSIEPDKNYPILQIYIPPNRNSIAIENLSGAPDNFNNKLGLIELKTGEERVFEVCYGVKASIVNSQ